MLWFQDPLLPCQAYKNLVASTGEEQQMLPGLPYSPDQLFFIGSAQVHKTILFATVSCNKAVFESTKSVDEILLLFCFEITVHLMWLMN